MENFMSFGANSNGPVYDTSETIHISSLALLKMMKHGRAGIPLEVMGLMLGEFVDEYNVKVIDVFSMPQSGTSVTIEAVDPVFQTKMLDVLRATGRTETVVGWYHSHPGFGCWLSSTDVSTQSAFETICKRAVAVVVDPIQSVKGKVVIDAFRNIEDFVLDEPRLTTSNLGYLKKPTFVSIVHGLNQKYYSFNISFEKNALEERMLLNLNKKTWADNLKTVPDLKHSVSKQLENYCDDMLESFKKTKEEVEMSKIGKINYKKRILENYADVVENQVINSLIKAIHRNIFGV
ncbi:RPN11 [Ecytonucleospora hepatopenaei]|uniref:RPN11 n=1 Tax=Ecytonucleospora hepatopenaei TaxID=646526 RepID=A0A1W0E794_9MICR|nr:RPN11 [Ecytonucleospora hepatopenaei]